MLCEYYPIKSRQDLLDYLKLYVPLAIDVANRLGININPNELDLDHVGLQTLSKEEFDEVDKALSPYASLEYQGSIHNRRNNLYQIKEAIEAEGFEVNLVETFEPKPDADIKKLKAGIEHLSFIPNNFDSFYHECLSKNVPIDKYVENGNSRFFKTVLINMIEIEFRSESFRGLIK